MQDEKQIIDIAYKARLLNAELKMLELRQKQEKESMVNMLKKYETDIRDYFAESGNTKIIDEIGVLVEARPRKTTVINIRKLYGLCVQTGRMKDVFMVCKPLVGKVKALFDFSELMESGVLTEEINPFHTLKY